MIFLFLNAPILKGRPIQYTHVGPLHLHDFVVIVTYIVHHCLLGIFLLTFFFVGQVILLWVVLYILPLPRMQ
jgi:hypothetical protein